MTGEAPVIASNGTGFALAMAEDIGGGNYVISIVGLPPSIVNPGEFMSEKYNPPGSSPVLNLGINSVAIASNGSGYLIVWVDDRNGQKDIYGTLDMGSTGCNIGIAVKDHNQKNTAVTFGGGKYLVVWSDGNRTGSTGGAGWGEDVYGRFIYPNCTMEEEFIIDENNYPSDNAVFVQSNGTDFFVTFDDAITEDNSDLIGILVYNNGDVGERIEIANSSESEAGGVVAWMEDRYLVGYAENWATPALKSYSQDFYGNGSQAGVKRRGYMTQDNYNENEIVARGGGWVYGGGTLEGTSFASPSGTFDFETLDYFIITEYNQLPANYGCAVPATGGGGGGSW